MPRIQESGKLPGKVWDNAPYRQGLQLHTKITAPLNERGCRQFRKELIRLLEIQLGTYLEDIAVLVTSAWIFNL